jgi:hypothetical protein
MVLGRSAQAQKPSAENVRQSFHLVNPPEIPSCRRAVKEEFQGDAPFRELP